ncbi:hypothetical protein EYF80_060977 [Liparis tanakae]|uniref:Uncharacterized protein n=1 Tax=Liparis tanakae TaxID=230148 RepID=A0A4Z2EJD0_9TELE|nr:hypothetical protein EYF80_060977 [Liparis tanakae]
MYASSSARMNHSYSSRWWSCMYFSIMNDFFCGGYESSTSGSETTGTGTGPRTAPVPSLEKNSTFPGMELTQVRYAATARDRTYFFARNRFGLPAGLPVSPLPLPNTRSSSRPSGSFAAAAAGALRTVDPPWRRVHAGGFPAVPSRPRGARSQEDTVNPSSTPSSTAPHGLRGFMAGRPAGRLERQRSGVNHVDNRTRSPSPGHTRCQSYVPSPGRVPSPVRVPVAPRLTVLTMNPFTGPSQPIGGAAVTSRDEGRAQAAPLQPH